MRSVAVFRALHLGDMLCVIPALRALRAALPDARVSLMGLPWARKLVSRFDRYLDEFIAFPGFPGLPEREPRLCDLPAFIERLQRATFDLALQLHGTGAISNLVIALSGARRYAGGAGENVFRPAPGTFVEFAPGDPEVRRALNVLAAIGIPARGESLEFPVRAADKVALHRALGPLPDGYACVHAGAKDHGRRWAARHFAAVADDLVRRGLRVYLTGMAAERELVSEVLSLMTARAVNAAGRTSLGALAALLAGARVLVSNDTGVAHLAEAVGAPSVVLFEESQVSRWGPRDTSRHRVVTPLDTTTPAAVSWELDDLLGAARPRRARRGESGARPGELWL